MGAATTEIQKLPGKPLDIAPAVNAASHSASSGKTFTAPFSALRHLVEKSRPLKRPNRSKPLADNQGAKQIEASDVAEWEQLESEALSNERIDAIANYLRDSGQASA